VLQRVSEVPVLARPCEEPLFAARGAR